MTVQLICIRGRCSTKIRYGSWGHFISNKTKKVDRTLAETIYSGSPVTVEYLFYPDYYPKRYSCRGRYRDTDR